MANHKRNLLGPHSGGEIIVYEQLNRFALLILAGHLNNRKNWLDSRRGFVLASPRATDCHMLLCLFRILSLVVQSTALGQPVRIEPLWLRDQAVAAPLPIASCDSLHGSQLRIVIEVLVGPRGNVIPS